MGEYDPEELAGLVEHACRVIHASQFSEGLNPAQWTALRYFARMQPRDRTIASLARFQGLSIAPVARSAQVLVDKGLCTRTDNPHNPRSDQFKLTEEGKAMLERDPRRRLIELLEMLPDEQRHSSAFAMRVIVEGLLNTGRSSSERILRR